MGSIDRLFEAVAGKGHVCAGLDTAAEHVPPYARHGLSDADAVLAFNRAIVDATVDVVACYKVQIAYYEAMGLAGLAAYSQTLRHIRAKGGIAIADVKRGDIAETAARYAQAHFSGDFEADLVTLSPYMGMDSVEPWLEAAGEKGKGAFVLMRTSNKGMRDFQSLEAAGVGGKKRLYDIVGDRIAELAARHAGACGYGAVGAVVGCTEREGAAEIRARYPGVFFLIPGYGAQGGAARDAALLLRGGNGGVVNASRPILKAWQEDLRKSGGDERAVTFASATEASRRAAVEMRGALLAAAGAGA